MHKHKVKVVGARGKRPHATSKGTRGKKRKLKR